MVRDVQPCHGEEGAAKQRLSRTTMAGLLTMTYNNNDYATKTNRWIITK